MARASKADKAAKVSGQRMGLQDRIERYRADGRITLTPRQLRRAAHKARVSTDEVRQASDQ